MNGRFWVFDIHRRICVECTMIAYLYACDSEDIARQEGKRWCKCP
jgi:hypothetical protein